MHKFDPTQPHGQVCGAGVRLWEQNGVIFTVNHKPVEMLPDGTHRHLTVPDAPVDDLPTDSNYAAMTVEQLKQLCVVYDIKYENRQQAVKALEGA